MPRLPLKTVTKETLHAFREDDAGRMGAALAFYITISIIPLVMFSLLVLGRLFGAQAARDQVFGALVTVLSEPAARAVQDLVLAAAGGGAGLGISLVGILVLLFASSTMFQHLRHSLNHIWRIPEPRPGRLRRVVVHQWMSLLLTLLVQVLLVVIFFTGTLVTAAIPLVTRFIHGGSDILLRLGDLMVSLLGVVLLIALIFRVLPRGRLPWRAVWLGAAVTAVLLLAGRALFRLYLSVSPILTLYGAAGSLLVLLLWVFYVSLIFYLGAEFTGVYAKRREDLEDEGPF